MRLVVKLIEDLSCSMGRICFLGSALHRRDSRVFGRLCHSLVMAGFQPSLIVCDNEEDEMIDGISIISTGFKTEYRWKRMLFSKKQLYVAALKVDADIYHISEPELISLGMKLKRLGKKVVFDMREGYPEMILSKEYIPGILRRLVYWWLKWYMKKTLKKFDAVFSVTPELQNRLQVQFHCKNSYVVTNYPNMDSNYRLSLDEYLKRDNVVCYIGSIYRISCQEKFFEALERIPKVKYLLAGKFWENYKVELMKLPYWSRIEFIDGFKREELSHIFSRAIISNTLRDFSKTASPNGSLGVIKIFESMEAALPVICSDVPLYREIVKKYNCGICVDPYNVNEIETAVRFLIENKQQAYEMGQNGRTAIIKEYNWNKQFLVYKDVIIKVINNE